LWRQKGVGLGRFGLGKAYFPNHSLVRLGPLRWRGLMRQTKLIRQLSFSWEFLFVDE
jgi:hypothetical protein